MTNPIAEAVEKLESAANWLWGDDKAHESEKERRFQGMSLVKQALAALQSVQVEDTFDARKRLVRVILQDLEGKGITEQRAEHLAARITDEGFRRQFAPVASGTVSREAIDINGHEVESAVDNAWENNAVDFLGVEQRSMTYREFVTAGYEIAKTIFALQLHAPQAPQIEGVVEALKDTTAWVKAFHCQCDPEMGNAPCSRCFIVERNNRALATLKAVQG